MPTTTFFPPNDNKNYRKCVTTLSKNPEYCETMGAKEFPALFPNQIVKITQMPWPLEILSSTIRTALDL